MFGPDLWQLAAFASASMLVSSRRSLSVAQRPCANSPLGLGLVKCSFSGKLLLLLRWLSKKRVGGGVTPPSLPLFEKSVKQFFSNLP